MLRSPIGEPLGLDWSRFDHGEHHRRFEDLALDLFASTHGEQGFTPNARRGGRDGGADGIFIGRIGEITGRWKIAAAVRGDRNAVTAKIKHENQGARDGGFDGLFFITSFDAQPVDADEARALAGTGLRGAEVWARGKLQRLLRDAPWLRQQYFGHLLIPGFVPPDWRQASEDLAQPDLALIGRVSELEALRRFVAGPPRIAVVVAEGGSGKSRLLRALPDVVRDLAPRRSAWLRRAGQGSIEEGLRSGLPAARPTVVALDDAALFMSEVQELTRLATDGVLVCKVVLAIRPSDRPALVQAIGGLREQVVWLELGAMSASECIELASSECPGLAPEDARRLARYFGANLFLLRAAAQLVRAGRSPTEVVEDGFLRGRIADRLIKDATSALVSSSCAEVLDALLKVTLETPLPLAVRAQDPRMAVLLEAKLLRQVGNTLRLRSDVEGDALLAHLLETVSAKVSARAALTVDDGRLPIRLRNLRMAGRGHAASLVRELVMEWSADPRHTPAAIWDLLTLCAQAAPEEVAGLAVELARTKGPSSEEITLVVKAVGSDDAARAMRLADELLERSSSAGDLASFVDRLGEQVLNPLFHRMQELQDTCALVQQWVGHPCTAARSALSAGIVKALLLTVVRWDSSDGATFMMHEQPRPPGPLVLELRQQAISVLCEMLRHADRQVRKDALTVLEAHGTPSMARVASSPELDEAAAAEFAAMGSTLAARLDQEQDLALRVTLYVQLAKRWAAGWAGAEICEALLRGRELAPLEKAYQVSDDGDWFFSFDEEVEAAPTSSEDRWSWWVKRVMPVKERLESLDRVVAAVATQHLTGDQVRSCAQVLAAADHPLTVLEPWCRRAPALFRAAAQECEDARTRALLERCLRRHDYAVDPRALLRDLEALPPPAPAEQVLALLADRQSQPLVETLRLARYLVGHPDVPLRAQGVDLLTSYDLAVEDVVSILEIALRDGAWARHWKPVQWLTFRHAGALRHQVALRQLVLDRLAETSSSFDLENWCVTRLLDALGGDDDDVRLDLLGEVLQRRSYHLAHLVGRLLVALTGTRDRLLRLLDRLASWCERLGDDGPVAIEYVLCSSLGEGGFGERDEARQAVLLQALEPCLHLLRDAVPSRQVVGLTTLSLMNHSATACAAIADVAAADGPLRDLAERKLSTFRSPWGGWTRSAGSPSPQLVALRDLLGEAERRASAAGRPAIASLRSYVQRHLDGDARKDEEELDPR